MPNEDASQLFNAAEDGDEARAEKLLASGPEFDPNDGEFEDGRLVFAPLTMAAMFNFPAIVRMILQHPKTNPNITVAAGGTSLIMACQSEYASTDSALLIINDSRTDVNKADPETGKTALYRALENGNWELVAALLSAGADASDCFSPLTHAIICGKTSVAQKLLNEGDSAPEVTPLLAAVIKQAPPAEIQACIDTVKAAGDASIFDLGPNTAMPALYFAVELKHAKAVEQILAAGGLKGADLSSALEMSAKSTDFMWLAKALLESGIVERNAPIRKTLLGYFSSVAGALAIKSKPDFDQLKKTSIGRLEVIMANLESIYATEGLASLGEVGAHLGSAQVRLDDPGLMPYPSGIDHVSKETVKYEVHLAQLIYMVSHALNKKYVAKLKEVLQGFGDTVKVLKDGTFQVFKGGVLQVELMQAPIKSVQRMRNKLSDPNDHLHKKLPRPMHNIDTIRARVRQSNP